MRTISLTSLPPLSELQEHTVLLRAADGQADIDSDRPAGFPLELERPDNETFIDIRINAFRTRALVDPTATKTYIDAILAAEYPDIFQLEHGRGIMPSCRVAGIDFPAIPITAADLSEHDSSWPLTIIIGQDFLSHGDFFFDFPRNAWFISKVRP
ncbi:MAG: hypothetical protein ACRDAX_09810 [Propionibacteriaceae bacterium]